MSSSNLHAAFGSEITVTTVSCAQYVNAFAVTLDSSHFYWFCSYMQHGVLWMYESECTLHRNLH
jgi:hypothetical protein